MNSIIDVVIESAHPMFDQFSATVEQLGGTVIPCTAADWTGAIAAGNAECVLLVDRRAAVLPEDLSIIAADARNATTPIQLRPAWSLFVWDSCPPPVAVCWNTPLEFALIAVRRSQLAMLPKIEGGHPEPLWEWLTRASLQENVFSCAMSAAEYPARREIVGTMPPTLVPSAPDPQSMWLIQHIKRLKPSQLVPEKSSEADAVAVKAGLLQWHDALDDSHQLSQSVEGLGKHQSGDYWHAINHRREPDYGNAKYWFRQLGTHSVFAELPLQATMALESIPEGSTWISRLIRNGSWDPFAFVDLCEACAGQEDSDLGFAARRIQAIEMQRLLAETYRDASGRLAPLPHCRTYTDIISKA